MNDSDSVLPEMIRRGLGTSILGRAIHYFPECASTNELARNLAQRGEPEGALVITDYQSAGRGRMSRSWQAPAGSSLLFSLLLRPPIAPDRALQAAMAASLGAVDGIRRECGLEARLKWPNDIFIGGKKTGGMLSELGLNGEVLDYVVIGIGLNVNFDPRGMEGIPSSATSLFLQLGRALTRASLLRAILESMEPRYRKVRGGESLCAEWARALETIGQRVTVALPEEAITGEAESVEEGGALVLRLESGARRKIVAGDVVRVGPPADGA
jgi:BirA family biotin operon repressor/biotin-[acetyl-CoA-carboxylase] ligase